MLTNDWQHGQESQNKYVYVTFVRDEWRWQSIRRRAGEAETALRPPVTTGGGLWWSAGDEGEPTPPAKSVRHAVLLTYA